MSSKIKIQRICQYCEQEFIARTTVTKYCSHKCNQRAYFKTDDLYSQLYQKHFKKTYAGKPTKKYLRIMEQIQKAESIPYHDIERAMLS